MGGPKMIPIRHLLMELAGLPMMALTRGRGDPVREGIWATPSLGSRSRTRTNIEQEGRKSPRIAASKGCFC